MGTGRRLESVLLEGSVGAKGASTGGIIIIIVRANMDKTIIVDIGNIQGGDKQGRDIDRVSEVSKLRKVESDETLNNIGSAKNRAKVIVANIDNPSCVIEGGEEGDVVEKLVSVWVHKTTGRIVILKILELKLPEKGR